MGSMKLRNSRVREQIEVSSPPCFLHEIEPPKNTHGGCDIRVRRVYEKPDPNDGRRLLVDRLWPRGLSKADARLDGWVRDLAPSPELRKWFGHDPKRWLEFRKRYRAELSNHRLELADVREISKRCTVTLLYAAHDPKINHAVVLQSILRHSAKPAPRSVNWGRTRE